MKPHVFIFCGTFLLGALVALAARTAGHAGSKSSDSKSPTADSASAASAHAAPKSEGTTLAFGTSPRPPGGGTDAASPSATPVNTVCAICGMAVDPKLPTATYQGKTIGFGCRMCAPKFQAEPDKYGPLYLRNEVIAR